MNWHRLSAHSEGIKFHIGTTNYIAILRVFRDVGDLDLFHHKGFFCNCVSASSNRIRSTVVKPDHVLVCTAGDGREVKFPRQEHGGLSCPVLLVSRGDSTALWMLGEFCVRAPVDAHGGSARLNC